MGKQGGNILPLVPEVGGIGERKWFPESPARKGSISGHSQVLTKLRRCRSIQRQEGACWSLTRVQFQAYERVEEEGVGAD